MIKLRKTLLLATSTLVVGAVGFTFDAATRPDPLRASANCGQFNGKMCQANCNSQCGDGSCCSWSFYYYYDPGAILPPP
jgi:hypothetical protein